MKSSRTGQIVTALSIQGPWIKVIQAESEENGGGSLLGLKAKKIENRNEESLTNELRELIRTLPIVPKEVVGLLSKGELLTRYLTLPSEDPEELRRMALYQLEGMLPFPVQECVTSVKILGPMGEATRVLAAVVHRPNVEQLIRVCQRMQLKIAHIAISSEAVGQWHQSCWPPGEQKPAVWLVADVTSDGLDLAVLIQGSPVYMRQILHLTGGFEELVTQLQETVQAYVKERIGPPVEQLSIGGALEGFGGGPLERLEAALGVPVHRLDPLESSPFRDSLSVAVQEFSSEISFSDLLGVVCAPGLLKLDLLPLETRWKQAREQMFSSLRQTAALLTMVAVLVAVWSGLKMGGIGWQSRQVKEKINLIQPQAQRVQEMLADVQQAALARGAYAYRLQLLDDATKTLLPGMNLQFCALDKEASLILRGTAPEIEAITDYAAALHGQKLWKDVQIRSIKRQEADLSLVEFEMVLQ